jgi:tetratricopeptide (TPR) repeat protein
MTLEELEEERDFLLESLRDLEREREAGEIREDDYQALHDDYAARAAAVLRAIRDLDGRGPRAGRAVAAPVGTRARVHKMIALVVLGSMAALALASVVLLSGQREPGQPATGSVPTGLAGLLARAHDHESRGEAVEALRLYDEVLRQDPANVEALAYRGWLLKLAGLTDLAQQSLDRAVAVNPAYPDARFFRGMLLYQDRDDPAAAVPEFEAFLAADPPPGVAEAVRGTLERARAEAAGRVTAEP